jgi:hypothetical protein
MNECPDLLWSARRRRGCRPQNMAKELRFFSVPPRAAPVHRQPRAMDYSRFDNIGDGDSDDEVGLYKLNAVRPVA